MKRTLFLLILNGFVGCVYSPRNDKSSHTNTYNYYGETKRKSTDEEYIQYKQNDLPALSEYNTEVKPISLPVIIHSHYDNGLVANNNQYVPRQVIHYNIPTPNRSIYYIERGF